jgi:hypothetical protein
MNARTLQMLLVAAAVLYVGVARTHLTAAPSLATGATAPRLVSTHGRTLPPSTVSSVLNVAVHDDAVEFSIAVTNDGPRKVEVNFPTGQTHDLVVYDAAGSEVWRWGAAQMFTQTLRNMPLAVNESLHYTVRWQHPAAHGPLVAVGSLTSTNYPIETRAAFKLP